MGTRKHCGSPCLGACLAGRAGHFIADNVFDENGQKSRIQTRAASYETVATTQSMPYEVGASGK